LVIAKPWLAPGNPLNLIDPFLPPRSIPQSLFQSFAHISNSHAEEFNEQHSHHTELDETTGEELEVQFALGALLLLLLGVVIVAVVAVAVASTAVLQRSRERVSQYSAHSSNPTLYGNATILP
jgi:hypothetical protein